MNNESRSRMGAAFFDLASSEGSSAESLDLADVVGNLQIAVKKIIIGI